MPQGLARLFENSCDGISIFEAEHRTSPRSITRTSLAAEEWDDIKRFLAEIFPNISTAHGQSQVDTIHALEDAGFGKDLILTLEQLYDGRSALRNSDLLWALNSVACAMQSEGLDITSPYAWQQKGISYNIVKHIRSLPIFTQDQNTHKITFAPAF